ncbi:MAG: DUF4249 domain-containing protein, partial [Bacteroidota bacterium]|nr:DUF4249 domain-containing protein [Bacteroidota bacterium]MDX5431347.1 DUF4249 domain-containing protein [Bacteroidota bacterium]MDX5470075.1 DUF4249 domain-containing protein [Bacteroidota bacterium]
YSTRGKSYLQVMEDMMVEEAEVRLIKDGRSFLLESTSKGIHALVGPSWNAGTEVGLEIRDKEGKLKAKAVSVVQALPEINRLDVWGEKKGSDTLFQVDLSIRTEADKNSWYLVTLNKSSDLERLKVNGKKGLGDVLSDRALKEKRAWLVEQPGGRIELNLKQELPWLEGSDSLVVQVSRLEEPYYHYLDQMMKADSWYFQLSGEILRLQGNVRGGYGYFSLHSGIFRLFTLNDRVR